VPELRDGLRDEVVARRPVDARERDAIAAFVDQLDRLVAPFDEHADRVHVTASAIVTGERGVVLHRHKRLRIWLQPGGHIESGEAPWDAARREAAEETGLPVEPVGAGPHQVAHVDVHPGPRGHTHLDVRYLFAAPGGRKPSPAAGESQEVAWFGWRDAIDLAEPGLEGILRALQPGDAVLRRATVADGRRCAAAFMRARAFALPTVPFVHTPSEIRRWWGDEVIGHADVHVADVGGVVAGVLVLDDGWIAQLHLDPSWIGRGLGDRFVALAKERAPAGLDLWTFVVNEPARRFYARHGFVEIERTDGTGNEERAPDVRLRWSP